MTATHRWFNEFIAAIPLVMSVPYNHEFELELENNLFDKKYINVSTGYYKHTENDTHCRETLTLVQYVPLSREPPGKYK